MTNKPYDNLMGLLVCSQNHENCKISVPVGDILMEQDFHD